MQLHISGGGQGFIQQLLSGGSSEDAIMSIAAKVYRLPNTDGVRTRMITALRATRDNDRDRFMTMLALLDGENAVDFVIHYGHDHSIMDHLEGDAHHFQQPLHARIAMLLQIINAMSELVEEAHRHAGLIGSALMAEFPASAETLDMIRPAGTPSTLHPDDGSHE